MLHLRNLSCGYTRRPVVSDIELGVRAGEFVCLLGPNGSGKTALLKTLAGILPPLAGDIRLDGAPLAHRRARERARLLAYVPQAHAPVFAFSARDVVVMGRAAQWPVWGGPRSADWRAADEALALVGLGAFAERLYTRISGGERQMVLIARALAQQARYLVLDEPASSLDFGNQVRVLQTLRRLAREGIGILMATHHPEHALRCATRVAIMRGGRLAPARAPAEALTAEALEEVYHVPFVVSDLPSSGDGAASSPIRVCAPIIN
ncbi:ABC transporter ATP-binding protein [Termitidicoccus mucosus]|uniref:ABC transporter domain-containing protein n=1 Tax=Termitidicoccus mucosus TaxID=1184151 RepID=A0A178IPX8_9BACT|nr:hypothetical protein AW736_03475 [Opitutaceae bacterium TSB47]